MDCPANWDYFNNLGVDFFTSDLVRAGYPAAPAAPRCSTPFACYLHVVFFLPLLISAASQLAHLLILAHLEPPLLELLPLTRPPPLRAAGRSVDVAG